MHRSLTFVVMLALSMLMPALAWAQPAEGEPDHEALRRLKALYEQAVAEDNVALIEPHLHVRFTGVMVTNDLVTSFSDLREYWAYIKTLIGEGGTYRVTVEPAALSEIVGDVAIARGVTKDHVVTSAGQEYAFSSRWTAVLIRDAGAWKILRIHASMDPITNPFVGAALRRTAIGSGLIGGAIGLVVGLVAMALWRRGRNVPAAQV